MIESTTQKSKKSTQGLLWMQRGFNQEGRHLEQVLDHTAFVPLSSYDREIDFKNLTPEKIAEYTKIILDETKAASDRVADCANQAGHLSFQQVVQPFIDVEMKIAHLYCMSTQMQEFSPNEEIRKASAEADKAIRAAGIELSMRYDVYTVMERYYRDDYSAEKSELSHEECRLVEDKMLDYKRSGMHLTPSERQEIIALKQKISANEIAYSQNLSNENTHFIFSKKQLAGMPENWFTEDKKVAKNKYKVTLKYPDYMPAMGYVKNRKVREQLFRAYESRCLEANTALFEETLKLRQSLAKLLGYACYADYQIEPKMAKTSQTVMTFLNEMNQRFTPLLEKDLSQLKALAETETGNPRFKLQPWDLRYYCRMNEEQLGEIDKEAVKQYFPLSVVRKGMFEIYEKLLGLKFIEKQTENKWHDSVGFYEVYNFDHHSQKLGEAVGSFYLDLHPREGKYGHAAVFNFLNGCDISKLTHKQGQRRLPIAGMACNFPENSCLPFEDVETLFHEFGHVMHHLCAKTQLSEYAAFSVEGDFVEAPSQMLENWCYSPQALKMMSSHIDTQEPIPDDIIEKIQQRKQILQGYTNKRQLSFGLFDMALHMPPLCEKRKISSAREWYKIFTQTIGLDAAVGTNMAASFGHLMGGYQAGYYGYMMSNTYAMDMFYTHFKGQELNSEKGGLYRKFILEPGSSKDAIEMLENFLGRKPQMDAFLEDKGIQEVTQQSEKAEPPRRSARIRGALSH